MVPDSILSTTIELKLTQRQKECLEEALEQYIEDSETDDDWYFPTLAVLDQVKEAER